MANVSSSNGLEKRPKLRFPGFDELWCSHKFSAVFSFLQNNTLSRAELDATGDVLDIHYGDVLIKYGSILDATDNTIPHIISGHESTNYDYLQDGDIIVADTAEDETVGKTIELLNISDRKIEAGLHTVPCRPLFPFASMYLGYYMNTPHYHKQLIPLMQGIKVLSISKGNISKTEISSPQTIAEQEKISRFLYLLDQRAAAQSKIIDALKSMLEGMAEYYSVELAQKINRGLRENALKGKSNGGSIPLGYRLGEDHRLRIDPLTAPVMREIFQRYADGETVREIIEALNERHLLTRKGHEFRMNSFNRLLKNRKYIGEYRYKDVVIPDAIPAIVPKELFERVQERMKKNQRAPARTKAEKEYLLTTKLFCGHCGRMMIGESGKGRNGTTHRYYKCGAAKRRQGCHKKSR